MEQYIEFFTNHIGLGLIWLGLVVMIIMSWVKSKFSPVKQVNPQQLTFSVNRENAVVLDIRSQADFNKGHIANSIHLVSEKAKQKEFTTIEKHKNDPIIVVCVTGMTASGVADNLFKAGFTQVSILSGGIGAWQSAGLPMTSGK
ncbi:rhodanese-like domain-containing protein [Pseudoalteromonas denitrificans]|uniref:Rhodanese-related sulfurtransferase n=1 Tax=Pseudoalteromonas denitrificans DSM 6059 TaxID=1123010 RepID=A0A1I1NXX8_9GAMM|nr:rhodanese-like domain-containing protein [Pseudoalteromonas denitrificans]SFD02551.1 Rhodanese-related sulfurtransferase [Pseudoalteromonas denitrificans DSM 6059]